ncbi:MAG: hypothetical protein IJR06_00655 [Paludibacteraceae bacterium]|nr:hypothetical protein [Paludibacteraceae bacterium]
MQKLELVLDILKEMGYQTTVSDEGIVCFMYELKTLLVLMDEPDNQYLSIHFPQFEDVKESDLIQTLTLCNKLTRELKIIKVFIDESFESVSASCEFYYARKKDLKGCIERALDIFSIIKTIFKMNKESLIKDLESSDENND